jgi:hypothetical protein
MEKTERMKKWRLLNPDYAKQKSKEWREKNKENVLKYRSTQDFKKRKKVQNKKYSATHKKHYEKKWEESIKYKFRINAKQYYEILLAQNNVCAICGGLNKNNFKLAIDHCHETGKIRGILCSHCNSGLGMFRDNTELMLKAIKYLENNKTTSLVESLNI